MPNDPFSTFADTVAAPARRAFAVVPSDTGELPILPKALYVGGGGTLVLRPVDGVADVAFRNVPAGLMLDVRAQFVRATGTTATDIVALA